MASSLRLAEGSLAHIESASVDLRTCNVHSLLPEGIVVMRLAWAFAGLAFDIGTCSAEA